MAAYTSLDDPDAFFQVVNYSGNGTAIGSGGNAVTLPGETDMQPDIVWIKRRDATADHEIADSGRGVEIRAYPSTDGAQDTGVTEALSVFGSDGFTYGNSGGGNASGGSYVAWCWKESADAGVDIVTYTGNGSNRTISHSLSAVPEMIIVKETSHSTNWAIYHIGTGNTNFLKMNDTAATEDTDNWQDTDPTSSVFSLGSGGQTNNSSRTYVAYCFAGKQGFSQFGQYEGNAAANGTFIYTGFKPKFLWVKSADSTSGAYMIPSLTSWFNGNTYWLYSYSNTTESNAAFVDFCSNGFKLRKNDDINNDETYVYACFAESPLVNSEGEVVHGE